VDHACDVRPMLEKCEELIRKDKLPEEMFPQIAPAIIGTKPIAYDEIISIRIV